MLQEMKGLFAYFIMMMAGGGAVASMLFQEIETLRKRLDTIEVTTTTAHRDLHLRLDQMKVLAKRNLELIFKEQFQKHAKLKPGHHAHIKP